MLGEVVAAEPDDFEPHALLAIAAVELERFDDATEHASRATSLAPDVAFVHWVAGDVARARGRLDEAEEALGRAIELDPREPDVFASLAQVHLGRKDWAAALDVADEGLAVDPESVACTNVRALALTKLGRREEATHALGDQLARTPENAVTHANAGWALLHAGDHRAAEAHFREALRLDPESEWARAGIRHSLQARNPLYRPILRFFLWMATMRGRRQAAILLGGWVVYRIAFGMADAGGALGVVASIGVVAYLLFVVGTWFAEPISAFLLGLHPLGTLALTRGERWMARGVVLALALGGGALVAAWRLDRPEMFTAGLGLLVTSACAVTAGHASAGRPRRGLVALTVAVLLGSATATWFSFELERERQELLPLLVEVEVFEEDRLALAKEGIRPREDEPAESSAERFGELIERHGRIEEFLPELERRSEELEAALGKLAVFRLVVVLAALVGSQVLAHRLEASAARR